MVLFCRDINSVRFLKKYNLKYNKVFFAMIINEVLLTEIVYTRKYKNYSKPVTYSVLKHGLLGMTKYLVSIYAYKKLRVNVLSLSPVKNKQKKQLIENLLDLILAKRLVNSRDIAKALLFLSEEIIRTYQWTKYFIGWWSHNCVVLFKRFNYF